MAIIDIRKKMYKKILTTCYYDMFEKVLKTIKNFKGKKLIELQAYGQGFLDNCNTRDNIYKKRYDLYMEREIMSNLINDKEFVEKYNLSDIHNVCGPINCKYAELKYIQFLIFKLLYQNKFDKDTDFELRKLADQYDAYILRELGRIRNGMYSPTLAKTNAFLFEKVFGNILNENQNLNIKYKTLLNEIDFSNFEEDYYNSKRIERFVYDLVEFYSIDDFLNEIYDIIGEPSDTKSFHI